MIERTCGRLCLIATLAAGLVAPCAASAGSGDPRCDDVDQRGHLNVLTINLLFSEIAHRNDRLESVADFATQNAVDVIFLQEVVAGRLVGTTNSAKDLQQDLADRGATYELRSALEVGVPLLAGVGNAILSRCDIIFHTVRRLPPGTEDIGNRNIKLPRNVLMARIDIPDRGRVDVYDTHLCAGCDFSERSEQLSRALGFIGTIESRVRNALPVVFAGDFNIDRFQDGEDALYQAIVAGFADAYAVSQGEPLDELCENRSAPDEHCTIGVSDFGDAENAERIDYVFGRGFPGVPSGRVVFNPKTNPGQSSVSDHSGVFVQLPLP
jgi:maltose 6'-phosphate phosphatase